MTALETQHGECPVCRQPLPDESLRCRHCHSRLVNIGNRLTQSHCAIALACLALLLLAPICVSRSIEKPLALGLPGVLAGDEPHYLVIINSLINDGDFDLANDYRDVHRGGAEAGRTFAGTPLDHHVNWSEGGRIVKWFQVYELDAERWQKDSDGHPVSTLKSESRSRRLPEHEYSQHPVGLAVVLAPVLFPFRGTSLVEPVAILCSGLATVAGCCAWCWLVKPYSKLPAHILGAAAVAYLGSPLWHYGLDLYVESFLAFFSVAAFAAALRGNNYWLAGLFLGAGVLMKSPIGLIALPLIGDALFRRHVRQALECAIPIALAAFLTLYWNKQMFGDWLRNPQEWETGPVMEGLLGLTFSWQHGLLWFSPALCVSALALPPWFQNHRRDAILMTLAVVLYVGLMAQWVNWGGGTCYSARLIVPIVPFLFAPLPLLFESEIWEDYRVVRRVGIVLMAVSILFAAVAAFGCDYVWTKHPLQVLLEIVTGRLGANPGPGIDSVMKMTHSRVVP
jgi:hypothetical protein